MPDPTESFQSRSQESIGFAFVFLLRIVRFQDFQWFAQGQRNSKCYIQDSVLWIIQSCIQVCIYTVFVTLCARETLRWRKPSESLLSPGSRFSRQATKEIMKTKYNKRTTDYRGETKASEPCSPVWWWRKGWGDVRNRFLQDTLLKVRSGKSNAEVGIWDQRRRVSIPCWGEQVCEDWRAESEYGRLEDQKGVWGG